MHSIPALTGTFGKFLHLRFKWEQEDEETPYHMQGVLVQLTFVLFLNYEFVFAWKDSKFEAQHYMEARRLLEQNEEATQSEHAASKLI